MGHCRYCGHRAGWLHSSHRQCAATYRQGLAQLVDLVVAASIRPDFTQRRMLRILDGLDQQCYVPAEYLPAVLAAGWHLSDLNRTVDRVPTRAETARVREFRDGHHPASQTPGYPGASILAAAARAALATRQRSPRIERVSNLLQRSGLSREEGPRRFKLPEHMPADEPETKNDIHENSPPIVLPRQLPPRDEDDATCGDDEEPGILLHDDRELSPGRIGPKVQVSRLNLLHVSVPGEEGRSGQEGGAHGQPDQNH